MTSKVRVAALLFALAPLFPTQALSQIHGQLGPARVLEEDVRLGIYALAGDDQVGALADVRFLLTMGLDLGIQFGVRHFSRVEVGETQYDGGVDLKYAVIKASEGSEVDFSLSGGFGLSGGDDLTTLTTAIQAAVSRDLLTSRDRNLTPYAGLLMSVAHVKEDDPSGTGEYSDPDLDLALRLGLTAGISGSSTLTGELQIKEKPVFYLGLGTSF